MKYILVTGGVISGLGKGVITSSLGAILKACGQRVTFIKIDPYINIDAGNFSPYEHGEVYVLEDGGEVDLDLGNYERSVGVTLTRKHNITSGKIYSEVIEKERKGVYLGQTVQVVPHITEEIKNWVKEVAKEPVDGSAREPEVCVIELGGVVGDMESLPFVEAFSQLQASEGKGSVLFVHVSLVPQPSTTGEHKTKPTQDSVRELKSYGISPDLIICRCAKHFTDDVKRKIGLFCSIPAEQVCCVPDVADVTTVYRVALLLAHSQDVLGVLLRHVRPRADKEKLLSDHDVISSLGEVTSKWKALAESPDLTEKEVLIVLVGKYTKLTDAYLSVRKALEHAAHAVSRRLTLKYVQAEDLEDDMRKKDLQKHQSAWEEIHKANGIVVPGGFGERGVEGKLLAASYARTTRVPYLGLCLGMQCAVIEFARNVLKLPGANSTEMDSDTKHPVVIEMKEHNPLQKGGTMRLGKHKTYFMPDASDSQVRKLYQDAEFVEERHRHRFEVNPQYVPRLEEQGMRFVGRSEDETRMEILEVSDHPFFVGVQFHPEYKSRPDRPSPVFRGFLQACCGHQQKRK